MVMRLPRPRHGDPLQTTQQLRELAASVLSEDVQTLARTTSYLRRSYRVVFIGYVAMMVRRAPADLARREMSPGSLVTMSACAAGSRRS